MPASATIAERTLKLRQMMTVMTMAATANVLIANRCKIRDYDSLRVPMKDLWARRHDMTTTGYGAATGIQGQRIE